MSEGNDKVTLAILGQQMREMLRRQDKTDEKLDGLGEKMDGVVTAHATCSATQEARWENHREEHSALNAKKWAGDVGASIVGVIAAAIAAISKAP